ncbi:MAG: RNA polymerase sigma factor [Gemmataceae bacterium]
MEHAGSSWSVHRLVDEHYAALYRYAYRLAGSASDAEDLTQEAFCQAHRKREQLRDPARAKAWLFSILRNCYLHRLRAEKHLSFVSLEGQAEPAESAAQHLPDIDPEQLQSALAELPEVYRTPVILFYFEDFSYRDIAEHMEVPLGTVMSRLARAKAFLRSRLTAAPTAHPAEGK